MEPSARRTRARSARIRCTVPTRPRRPRRRSRSSSRATRSSARDCGAPPQNRGLVSGGGGPIQSAPGEEASCTIQRQVRQERALDYLMTDMMQPAFWIAVGQIIWINILLSGDNAAVIALACRSLPPSQRFSGLLLGAGAAVVLRIFFTVIIAQIMTVPFLKLIGGVLLLWIAVKLIVPNRSEEHTSELQSRGLI